MTSVRALPVVSALVVLAACTATAPRGPSASASLEPRSGSSARGTARFTPKDGGLLVTLDVTGAREGLHGVHLHARGDCSAPDGASSGGDFDPGGAPHAGPGALSHHAGDLGNVMVTSDGRGHYEWVAKGLTLAPGPMSVVGRSFVLHAMPDDLATQPEGNSGAVVACGVVR